MGEWKNGLPPVGEVCEAKFFDPTADELSEWYTVEILKVREHGEAACLIQGETYNGRNLYWSSNLRPLKSEAERKRDEAVEEMMSVAGFGGTPISESGLKSRYAALHDAGYHKVNELTDEQIHKVIHGFISHQTEAFWAGAKWARSQIMGEES